MLNFLLTSRKVGVRSKPPRKRRIGIVSPRNSGYFVVEGELLGDTHHARGRRP